MIRKTLFFLLLSFGANAQESAKLKIDLDRAYGGQFSDYLRDIEYIPLESTKESLFGKISNLIITDSSFVVTDNDTRSILFFSTTGKYLKRISKSGFYNAVAAGYNVEKKTIEIQFVNNAGSKLTMDTYSVVGNFINKGPIIGANDTKEINAIYAMANSIVADNNNYWLKNRITDYDSANTFYFFSKYTDNAKTRSAIPLDTSGHYGLHRLTKESLSRKLPLVHNGNFYFATPIEHKVYKIPLLSGDPELLFQMVFPAKFGVNSKLLSGLNQKQVDSIVAKRWYTEKNVLVLENIIYDKDKIFFKTNTGFLGLFSSDGSITARNFLYYFQNNKLIAFEKINPDASTHFLPLSTPSIISFEGFYQKNKYLYTHISSLNMFTAYAANKNKFPQYPAVLKNYFKTQNRKSNPVIVRMKLKD